ncbi:hypothetical protein L209DRAFT_188312 [Thermothelomyces heterothallicus CBS 203.75]
MWVALREGEAVLWTETSHMYIRTGLKAPSRSKQAVRQKAARLNTSKKPVLTLRRPHWYCRLQCRRLPRFGRCRKYGLHTYLTHTLALVWSYVLYVCMYVHRRNLQDRAQHGAVPRSRYSPLRSGGSGRGVKAVSRW